jgi:hypothetical protein
VSFYQVESPQADSIVVRDSLLALARLSLRDPFRAVAGQRKFTENMIASINE